MQTAIFQQWLHTGNQLTHKYLLAYQPKLDYLCGVNENNEPKEPYS